MHQIQSGCFLMPVPRQSSIVRHVLLDIDRYIVLNWKGVKQGHQRKMWRSDVVSMLWKYPRWYLDPRTMKLQQDRCSKWNPTNSLQWLMQLIIMHIPHQRQYWMLLLKQRTKTPYSSSESQLPTIRCALTSKTLVFMSSFCNNCVLFH